MSREAESLSASFYLSMLLRFEKERGALSTFVVARRRCKIEAKQTKMPNPAVRRPPWIMRHVIDPLALFAVGWLGLDDHAGTRVLEVKGRASGVWRATPVRLLEMDGRRYLVAMYGETQWVKNLRAQGGGRFRMGGKITDFQALELSDKDKHPALRAYMKRYWSLVSGMTSVTSPDAPDEEIARAAPMHPVFRLE
jgi:deazaflavin-dependent oxidoreductase (nitroreductase family)